MQEGFCEEWKMILIEALRDACNSCDACDRGDLNSDKDKTITSILRIAMRKQNKREITRGDRDIKDFDAMRQYFHDLRLES